MILNQLPKDLGKFDIKVNETMFYLYMPIKMANNGRVRIPKRLEQFRPLVEASVHNSSVTSYSEWFKSYIYITAKHMLVNPDFWGNRGGAHADGFGTDDLNWVWYDKNPTEFNPGPFDVSEHEHESLKQFEEQWDDSNTVTYPVQHLLELNSNCVHRVARVTRYDMRTFVKISMSEHKYNLIGNSHNHLFDYNWEMHSREELRNQTHNNNSDYVPADVA